MFILVYLDDNNGSKRTLKYGHGSASSKPPNAQIIFPRRARATSLESKDQSIAQKQSLLRNNQQQPAQPVQSSVSVNQPAVSPNNDRSMFYIIIGVIIVGFLVLAGVGLYGIKEMKNTNTTMKDELIVTIDGKMNTLKNELTIMNETLHQKNPYFEDFISDQINKKVDKIKNETIEVLV